MAYETRRSSGNGYGSNRRHTGRRNTMQPSPVIGKRLSPKAREIFLEGMRRYQERGVRILLDGKEVDVSRLEVIFEEREDGSFYMGDYILEDDKEAALREQQESGILCEMPKLREKQSPYGTQGTGEKRLREIRFDRVYNW